MAVPHGRTLQAVICIDKDFFHADLQDTPGLLHGIPGVRAQIDQHLMHLRGIGHDDIGSLFDLLLYFYRRRQGCPHKVDNLFNDRRRAMGFFSCSALRLKCQNLLHQIFSPISGFEHLFHAVVDFRTVAYRISCITPYSP